MNSKTTGFWFVIAATLLVLVLFFRHFQNESSPEPGQILTHLQPQLVTSIQIIPAGALEIQADRTNQTWFLTRPVVYPAQSAAIEALLDALQKLTPAMRLEAGELHEHTDAEKEFGFDNPQFSIVIEAGQQRWQLKVGNKTAPGDQVFLRVVGVEGVFVANVDWLKLIPSSVNDWRDTALVDAGEVEDCNWIVVTNGAKIIELRCDATNHLWQMIRPLQARANSDRINDALQQLQTARVSRFVTDDPKTDLSAFGLQPAGMDIWLGHNSNLVTAIHIGKNFTNNSTQVYAMRGNWGTVLTTASEPLQTWHGAVNDFRDPHLFELTAPVAEIEMLGPGTNHFILQRSATNGWKVSGENFPVDTDSVQQFIKTLAGLRISEFVKDVVTAPDLQTYGLTSPSRQIILRSAVGDTNAIIAQLLFGAQQTNKIFVRSADEDFVYAITLEDFSRLQEAGWEFRERRIWNFPESDVAQITIHQNGKTRQIIHAGVNKWSLAAGSQGIINPPAIEETAHQLGTLAAVAWVGRNATNLAPYGFKTNDLEITAELKNGAKHTVKFSAELPNTQTSLASVTLDGERWVFIFPPVLYQLVLSYLTIPANVP
jgi:Domain of unknown function (DUF4340)